MAKLPGVSHLGAVRALERAGLRIGRQGNYIVMTNGSRIVTVPRHNPVNALTMSGIGRDAGLSVAQFRRVLRCGTLRSGGELSGVGLQNVR